MLTPKTTANKSYSEISAPEIETVTRYLHQLRSITIIRHLFPVIVTSQQHRGAKLALLEGDEFFRERVGDLQQEIQHRLLALNVLNREMMLPVDAPSLEALLHEWDIVKSWSGGPSLENYNLHSHFIEQQMKLLWQIAESTRCFIAVSGNESMAAASLATTDDLLIRFILHETPELIELIARIRGLASYALALGRCDEEQQAKLEYMLTLLNQKKEKFRVLSRQLQKYVLHDVPALIELQIQDVRIIQLVQMVNKTILASDEIHGEDHSIFSLATNIIDSQTEIVKQGLDYIQTKVHQQFDQSHAVASSLIPSQAV